MGPVISIIIPVFNGGKYIERSIKSALDQTFSSIEIIVVNDGSTDETLKIVRSLAEKDSRIKVLDQPNGGVNAARWAGIQASTGQWICFLDADDTLPVDALRQYSNHLTAHSDIIISGVEGGLDRKELLLGLLGLKIRPELWGKVFSSTLVKNHFPPLGRDIKMGEDLLQNLVMAVHCDEIATIPTLLYNINLTNPDSVTKVFKSTFEYETNWFHLLDKLVINQCTNLPYFEELENAVFKLKVNGYKKVVLSGNPLDTTSEEWLEVENHFASDYTGLGPSEKLFLKMKNHPVLYRMVMNLYLAILKHR